MVPQRVRLHVRLRPGISRDALYAPRHVRSSAMAMPEVLSQLASSPFRDPACLAVAVTGALAWVKLFKALATMGVIDQVS